MTAAVAGSSREPISVVVPFLGDAAEARATLELLVGLRTRPGDELILADNTPDGVVDEVVRGEVIVAPAGERRSASYARNVGAGAAGTEWLLFIDADSVPPADLLDRYLADAPGPRCGIVAGEIEGLPDQDAVLARWARSRRRQWVRQQGEWGPHPSGITANLLVRRSTFDDLGGFQIGGGEDIDLCWRAQDRGWELEYRPDVVVRHRDRERMSELARQAIRYGADVRRLRELHGPSVGRAPLLRPLFRSLGAALVWSARGQFERARFKLIDAIWDMLLWWGQLTGGPYARRPG
ncbi:MAG: glycosyltransferase family 2 protein [Solirubrobacterales bacterium]